MFSRDLLFSAASGGASGPDVDATAYFAAMSVQPDATRKALLTALIKGLKADGIWALLDWFSVLAAHDAQAARINAKNPAQVASVVSAPVFTTDRGYAGEATLASYLDTGVLDTAAGNSVQDSSCVFGWVNIIGALGGPLIGTVTGGNQRLTLTPGVSRQYRVHGTVSPVSVGTAPTTGLYSGSRFSSVDVVGYKNGAQEGVSAVSTSTAPTAVNYSFLRGAGISCDHRMAVGGWGGHLDATKQTALYNHLNTYLTAVGGA